MKMAKNMDIMVKMEKLEELTNTIKNLEEKAGEYPILLVEVEKLKEEFARLRNLCPVEMKWEEEMDENPDYNEQNATALPAEIVCMKKEEKLHIYEEIGKYYNWSMLNMDVKSPVSKQMKMDMKNKIVYITIERQTEEMELTHYVDEAKELNQNGHRKNICRNKLFSSSLKKEPPESQTLGHFWDKNVLPMDSEYYLGVKKKTQQRIGRQVSFNLLTSQVLGYNEPCQWKQRNSTHMGPVHCVNRKRKKKRTSQGLSRIELQHGKMKNLQPLLNLSRLLVHYII